MFQVHRLKKKLANDCQSYGSPTVISLSDRGFHSTWNWHVCLNLTALTVERSVLINNLIVHCFWLRKKSLPENRWLIQKLWLKKRQWRTKPIQNFTSHENQSEQTIGMLWYCKLSKTDLAWSDKGSVVLIYWILIRIIYNRVQGVDGS